MPKGEMKSVEEIKRLRDRVYATLDVDHRKGWHERVGYIVSVLQWVIGEDELDVEIAMIDYGGVDDIYDSESVASS